MIEICRWIMSKLFGVKWVVLIDHDGEENVRKVTMSGGQIYAYRYASIGVRVRLLDHGKTAGRSYVVGWKPYNPLPALSIPDHKMPEPPE